MRIKPTRAEAARAKCQHPTTHPKTTTYMGEITLCDTCGNVVQGRMYPPDTVRRPKDE